jgi:hypothetical protein
MSIRPPKWLSDDDVVRTFAHQRLRDVTLTSGQVVQRAFLNATPYYAELIAWQRTNAANFRAAAALEPLHQLGPGWDSYGALPVSAESIFYASNLLEQVIREGLEMPAVVPTVRGGVSLEWTSPGHEFSVTFENVPFQGIVPSAYYFDEESGEEWETDRADADPRVAKALQGLASAAA